MGLFKRSAAAEGAEHPATPTAESEGLRQIDDSLFMREEGFVDVKHRLQRAEWRQRQAYFEKYGRAPAPSIIRPGKCRTLH